MSFMKIVLQRTKEASVSVGGAIIGKIDAGFTLLVGVADGDSTSVAEKLARKICSFRVFEDDAGKMNLDIKDAGGSILSIPQFTLLGQTDKGNRPGFDKAAHPDEAKRLWSEFNRILEEEGVTVQTGTFGAHMEVSLINDGPVTFVLKA